MTEATGVVSMSEAIELIDRNLRELQGRELVAGAEVADLLLDLRSLIADAKPAEPAPLG